MRARSLRSKQRNARNKKLPVREMCAPALWYTMQKMQRGRAEDCTHTHTPTREGPVVQLFVSFRLPQRLRINEGPRVTCARFMHSWNGYVGPAAGQGSEVSCTFCQGRSRGLSAPSPISPSSVLPFPACIRAHRPSKCVQRRRVDERALRSAFAWRSDVHDRRLISLVTSF